MRFIAAAIALTLFTTVARAESIFSGPSYEGGTPGALIVDGLRLLYKMFA